MSLFGSSDRTLAGTFDWQPRCNKAGASGPPYLPSRSFNKREILERHISQFAGAQNQSLAAGVLEGNFESFRPT
jgi:hypothetical protein